MKYLYQSYIYNKDFIKAFKADEYSYSKYSSKFIVDNFIGGGKSYSRPSSIYGPLNQETYIDPKLDVLNLINRKHQIKRCSLSNNPCQELPIPSELYIEIKGAGQFAVGQEGQLPEYQALVRLTQPGDVGNEIGSLASYWATGNCSGQQTSVQVIIGENISPNAYTLEPGCTDCAATPNPSEAPVFAITLALLQDGGYWPATEDQYVMPQMEGGAMPRRWTCTEYCRPENQLAATLYEMTFDLVMFAADLKWTATIYTTIPEDAEVSDCRRVLVNGHGGEGFIECGDGIDCPEPSPS